MSEPPAQGGEWRPIADQIAANVKNFIDGVDALALAGGDETVPMLGNMTPRRAAKTMKGREKLVAWLKYMENQAANHQAGTPMANYDFSWLWDELGIADLRR